MLLVNPLRRLLLCLPCSAFVRGSREEVALVWSDPVLAPARYHKIRGAVKARAPTHLRDAHVFKMKSGEGVIPELISACRR